MNRAYPSRINWENEPSLLTPINATNLNKIDGALYEIDGRVVTFDTTKANQSDLLVSLKQISYNTTTGVFTFTYWNGTTQEVDLNIEKIPVSFSMNAQGIITMTTSDGTQYTADVASLIKTYTFSDTSIIDFSVTEDASGNKTVEATIKDGSITGAKLQPNYLADVTQAATDAGNRALISEGWAKGTQNGSPVDSSSPYYHNNAEYFKDQAGAAVTPTWGYIVGTLANQTDLATALNDKLNNNINSLTTNNSLLAYDHDNNAAKGIPIAYSASNGLVINGGSPDATTLGTNIVAGGTITDGSGNVLSNKLDRNLHTYSIEASSWVYNFDPSSTDYPYVYIVTASGMTATDVPICQLFGTGTVTTQAEMADIALVQEIVSKTDALWLYATAQPTNDLVLQIIGK